MQVTTVDRFQGQQNDYIILSLVRTKAVGHLRYDPPALASHSALRPHLPRAATLRGDGSMRGKIHKITTQTPQRLQLSVGFSAFFPLFSLLFFFAPSKKEAKFALEG